LQDAGFESITVLLQGIRDSHRETNDYDDDSSDSDSDIDDDDSVKLTTAKINHLLSHPLQGALNLFVTPMESELDQPHCLSSILEDFGQLTVRAVMGGNHSSNSSGAAGGRAGGRRSATTANYPAGTTRGSSSNSSRTSDPALQALIRQRSIDMLRVAGITTGMELKRAIDLGQLEQRLLGQAGVGQESIPDVSRQEKMSAFLHPIALEPDVEWREFSRLLVMANPEEAYLILHHPISNKNNNNFNNNNNIDNNQTNNNTNTNINTSTNGSSNNNSNNNTNQNHHHTTTNNNERDFFTYEEKQRFLARPLESRLFITGGFGGPYQIDGWLRTRFTDNAMNHCNLREYAQYFWDCHANQTGPVVATVSGLLLRYYELDRDDYYSEACTLASALSGNGKNVHVAIHEDATLPGYDNDRPSQQQQQQQHQHQIQQQEQHPPSATATSSSSSSSRPPWNQQPSQQDADDDSAFFDDDILRTSMVGFMSNVFHAIAKHRFLVEHSNSYRLAHCLTDGSVDKTPLLIPFFSFCMQLALLMYVIFELWYYSDFNVQYGMFTLGVLTSIYSSIQARNGLFVSWMATDIYKKDDHKGYARVECVGLLAQMDRFANVIIPMTIVFAGFFVVVKQEGFIEGVLNSAALLFITEIDEQLPVFFNLDAREIAQSYLLRKIADEVVSKMSFNAQMSRANRVKLIRAGVMPHGPGYGIRFCDIRVTNTAHTSHSHCRPHEIRPSVDFYQIVTDNNQFFVRHEKQPEKLYVKSSISADCLLKQVKWHYVRDSDLQKGYVDRLFLKKLDGTEILIDCHKKGASPLTPEMTGQRSEEYDGGFASQVFDDVEEENNNNNAHSQRNPIRRLQSKRNKKSRSKIKDSEEWDGEINGVFIITKFDVGHVINNLRICGTRSPKGGELRARRMFRRAVRYYSLWELDPSAQALLAGRLVQKMASRSVMFFNELARRLLESGRLENYDKYRWERLINRYDRENPDSHTAIQWEG
jgi:hypothetical protein